MYIDEETREFLFTIFVGVDINERKDLFYNSEERENKNIYYFSE